jgi:hypothetical protein
MKVVVESGDRNRMNHEIFITALYILLAGGLASMTSFPPSLPAYIIRGYDYPIIRVILLALVSGIGIYVPEIALLLAIGYGIVGEDIIKSSTKNKADTVPDKSKEGFTSSIEQIQLLPGPSDVEESKNIVARKTASLDSIQNTLRSLQIQIESMTSK